MEAPHSRPAEDTEDPEDTRIAEDTVAARARPWPPWALGTLIGAGLVLAGAVVVHLGVVSLDIAPSNAAAGHRDAVDAYLQRASGQDHRPFAADPARRKESLGVRLRTRGEDGAPVVSEWIDLTLQDAAATGGAPAGLAYRNTLRRAWDSFVDHHGHNGAPTGDPKGELSTAYLKRAVLQRIGREWRGRPVIALQVAVRFAAVPRPSWRTEDPPATTTHRMLPWWWVTDHDYRAP
ncbi:DUF5819 family protein [Streptomyces sp. NPDC006368]|uniref:DUF5819 family protein n=1 Tax=Streptomyces sp. NPDC006368 TaxID=3156760 RepID=UPI00339F5571